VLLIHNSKRATEKETQRNQWGEMNKQEQTNKRQNKQTNKQKFQVQEQ
jgi:hypothetical protein